jgi:hypothetical protein
MLLDPVILWGSAWRYNFLPSYARGFRRIQSLDISCNACCGPQVLACSAADVEYGAVWGDTGLLIVSLLM